MAASTSTSTATSASSSSAAAAAGAAAAAKKPFLIPGPTSPQSSFLPAGQKYLLIPEFHLESGEALYNVPVAFKTWGTLDPTTRANALLVAHALTGSADVEDWWGPLLGPGKLFDPTRFFVVCANVLGSPYGSASPCTRKDGQDDAHHAEEEEWDGTGWWGPEFPSTTVRDDVRIQKVVLDFLGIEQLAAVVGGSMGGMAVLEWPLCFPVRFPPAHPETAHTITNEPSDAVPAPQQQPPYIRALVPLATAARHSAWGISWAEAQRQSIYSDPLFQDGYYSLHSPPRNGLSAARMAALLTYRSRDSFESRFGRRVGKPDKQAGPAGAASGERRGSAPAINGNGATITTAAAPAQPPATPPPPSTTTAGAGAPGAPSSSSGVSSPNSHSATQSPKVFSAQSYLRYQGDKFVKRFDANCYIHLTRKMDSHDVARGRHRWGTGSPTVSGGEEAPGLGWETEHDGGEPAISSAALNSSLTDADARLAAEREEMDALRRVLGFLGVQAQRFGARPPHVQIVSIESDGLFAPTEQILLHELIPGSALVHVKSPDGHDGFLLEFEQINTAVGAFLRKTLAGQGIYEGEGVGHAEWKDWQGDLHAALQLQQAALPAAGAAGTANGGSDSDGTKAKVKESVFGEVEDVTRW
ncbi:homoserine O- acetyltransferase [Tilletia horrida]|nr:homoserine O- acetyltransferase [Tilletia horrida]